MTLPPKIRKRIQAGVDDEDHIASLSAISSIRTPARDIFLSAEVDDAIPPPPGCDKNLGFIKEHLIILSGDSALPSLKL
jgi:hypothetical protein